MEGYVGQAAIPPKLVARSPFRPLAHSPFRHLLLALLNLFRPNETALKEVDQRSAIGAF